MERNFKLDEYVCQGSAPLFGFPPVCYAPPEDRVENKQNREYLNVLMKHVFRRPETISSVGEIIEATKEQNSFLKNVMKGFMSGKKDSRNGGHATSPSAASPESHG